MKKGKPENLVPFKPGDDPRRNSYGANAGSQSLKSILERLLAKKVKIEEDGGLVEVTRKEAIALNIIVTALTEEDPNIMLKAAKHVFDTTDPITKDVAITMSQPDCEKALTPEKAAEILKIAQGERAWCFFLHQPARA